MCAVLRVPCWGLQTRAGTQNTCVVEEFRCLYVLHKYTVQGCRSLVSAAYACGGACVCVCVTRYPKKVISEVEDCVGEERMFMVMGGGS